MTRLGIERLNELGDRENNEDAIYPALGQEVHHYQRLFLVCDGVGGQEKGEVASVLLSQAFSEYVEANSHEASLHKALCHAEEQMVQTMQQRPETQGMATTLTALYFDAAHRSAQVAWVGDSRAYHIRDGRILFKTKDHSEVQSLIDMGEITSEEAMMHPKRNIITRAINGKVSAQMDHQLIANISVGDYFLLCTDGLMETLHEPEFPEIFKAERGAEAIRQLLLDKALGHTKDNFSMYLIQVKQMSEATDASEEAEVATEVQLRARQKAHPYFSKGSS